MRRYRNNPLENTIAWRCYKWDSKSLKKQISDVVDTVLGEVLRILCKNDFQVLKNFRHKDSESKFKAYLRMIASHETSRYLREEFPSGKISENELPDESDLLDTLRGIDDQSRWELYEEINNCFYDSARKKRGNLERDIHMFWLYVWSEFDQGMIINLPCLLGMEEHNVDVVVNRMKDIIRRKMDGEPL